MNLLIVDDEIVTTQVLEQQLDRNLLSIDQIYVAYNAAMAREILKEKMVDLVICDIEMPQENGIHLLEWVREQEIKTEFVFLTSHEKFEYAYGAVQNGAANYLLKPIDMEKINKALFQVIEKILWKQKSDTVQEYWRYGKRKIVRYFWTRLLLEPALRKQGLEDEIRQLGINEDIGEEYCLVFLHFSKKMLKISGDGAEKNSINKFIIENILSESFTKDIKMENVICWEANEATYVAVLSEFSETETDRRAGETLQILKQYFPDALQIGYISETVPYYEISSKKEQILEYDRQHIYDEGEIKRFSELKEKEAAPGRILDENYLYQCLQKGARVDTMKYLQKVLENVKQTMHSVDGFKLFQMELTQSVNKYIHDCRKSMSTVFCDPVYLKLDTNALSSEFAMVQWMTWLLNKGFDLTKEEDTKTEKNITDQMVAYIRSHYTEDINRNVLAEHFHFSPEYIGKTFRKDMGVSLNDYINTLRVEKAKHLLKNTSTKVIDIALEVGFDTLPYFSSVFKKYTGISPAEFRKQN